MVGRCEFVSFLVTPPGPAFGQDGKVCLIQNEGRRAYSSGRSGDFLAYLAETASLHLDGTFIS